MKFLIFSDLHLEFLTQKEIEILFKQLEHKEVDICLVAGDISPVRFSEYKYFLDWLSRTFKQSFVILGNHEFYHSTIHKVLNQINLLSIEYNNIEFLYNQTYNHQEYIIGGTTLWFDNTNENIIYRDCINCWKQISDLKTQIEIQNNKSIKFIKKFNNLKTSKKILLTHYLPSHRSVSNKYKSHPINLFYVCDLSNYLDTLNFDLIVHGHTHDSCDYMLGDTRIVCNPYGYEHQNKEFDFCKIVEVPNRT